ncbi:MAG TPA: hypothetical protein VF679_11880, partial [Pedobacter sp.]
KTGLIQKVEYYTGLGDAAISGNATLLKQVTGFINDWYGICISDILNADGRWEYDDTNHTDLPVITTALMSGQQDYTLTVDDNSAQILEITRVEIKDPEGNWHQLRPKDQRDIKMGFSEYGEEGGIPTEFDVNGATINLFPTPNFSQAASLKGFVKREGSYFASIDTTKKAGFAAPYHIILALGASYDFGLAKGKGNTATLRQELEQRRAELVAHYSRRNKFEQPTLRAKSRSSR